MAGIKRTYVNFNMTRLLIICSLLFSFSDIKAIEQPAKKYLDITVSSNTTVFMWPDTLTHLELAKEVQERLWKSYLGTGKMYDEIRITYENGLSDQQKTEVLKAIREGQSKALIEVSLHKNKKRFEELSSRQQNKIKRQFPVLFQSLE